MGGRQQLRFALVALAAGLVWGYLRHRQSRHRGLLSVLQGLEWFIAYGGAVAVIEAARQLLEPAPFEDEAPERITHFRQVIAERTGTEG